MASRPQAPASAIPEAAEDLGDGGGDEDVADHPARRRAERAGIVLVDRVQIGRGSLRADVEDDHDIEDDQATAAGAPDAEPNQQKGAATRIGTVPAVMTTGSMTARTRPKRADTSPARTPITEPTATAMATFSAV